MFADACSIVSEFAKPVVISTRHRNGTVNTECGTFIVLNREGWILTAGHIYDSFVKFQADRKKADEIEGLNSSRRSKPGAPSSEIKMDPDFITNHSFWWGWDGVRISNIYVNRQVDIAVGKLEPFNPDWVRNYPVFRDPDGLRIGTSVCRAGYAFVNINATWDDATSSFRIPRINNDELIFPNEGIHTRTIKRGNSKDGNYEIRYVETSSPGLKGQSGGPIFDTRGRIYAMQIKTAHIPLGFHPSVEYDGQTVVENQFLNVGIGLHVKTIRSVLDSRHVRYEAEEDADGFRIVG